MNGVQAWSSLGVVTAPAYRLQLRFIVLSVSWNFDRAVHSRRQAAFFLSIG